MTAHPATSKSDVWYHWRVACDQAIAHPEEANLAELWKIVEPCLNGLERDEKLRMAGEVISLLAEICHARAEWMLSGWNERWKDHPNEEPILSEEMLSAFLRQSMSLNIDDLLEDITHTRNRAPQDSIAAECDKQSVLDWLEQEEEKERALAVAHDENVSEWVTMIHTWLEEHQQQGTFRAIVRDLQGLDAHLTPVAVWLALLLGGFELKSEQFYCSDFFVAGSDRNL